MISVKVLGPGCPNCERVEQHTFNAARRLLEEIPDADIQIEKLSDPSRFHEYGILGTPGLVINGQVVSSGRIPSESQILGWMRAALQAA